MQHATLSRVRSSGEGVERGQRRKQAQERLDASADGCLAPGDRRSILAEDAHLADAFAKGVVYSGPIRQDTTILSGKKINLDGNSVFLDMTEKP